MTGTYKVGVAGSGGIYLEYLLSKAAEIGQKVDGLARYYAGRENEMPAMVVEMGRQVHVGDLHRNDAITKLVQSRVDAGLPAGQDVASVTASVSKDLDTAIAMTAFRETGTAMAGARIRPDLDPTLARRLEIDLTRPLTVRELTRLLNNETAAGNEIEGRKKHSEHRSVADIFGLDPKAAPTVDQIKNVLAGRRTDGSAVLTAVAAAPVADTETPEQHMEAWLAGTAAPNLDKLAAHAAAGGLGEGISQRLVNEIDSAIAAIEGGNLSPEARALHGLPEPYVVPAYLRGLAIEALTERRETVLEQWEAAWATAEYHADLRADGVEPAAEHIQGTPLPTARIESAIRKFKSACGLDRDRDATDEEIEQVTRKNDLHDYRKGINATAPPIAYVDVVWSADKSVSVAWALSPTEAEAEIFRMLVRNASATAMKYLEGQIGVARSGAGGSGTPEPATMAWISIEHIDARPTVDVIRVDADGNEFTETRDIPESKFDPQLHVHNPVLSSMLTPTGRVSAVNLDLLKGELKVFGKVGHAALATEARSYGIDVKMGPHGEARIAAIPEWLRQFYSRRTTEGTLAAEAFVKKHFDKEWSALSPEQRISLLDKAVGSKRRDKDLPETGDTDRTQWIEEAERAGYQHRSVLRPGEKSPELAQQRRIEVAREASLLLFDKALQDRAVISHAEMREIAASGLTASGMGKDPAADIEAIVETYRQQGVTVRGVRTNLIEFSARGKEGRIEHNVTTGGTVALEESVIAAVRTAANDRSTALTPLQIDLAAKRFLATHPKVDPTKPQWQAQLAMAHLIGEGGRVSMSIGVAGSGKTSAVTATLVDAWHAEGRTVYGMTVPWRSSAALRDAGVDHAIAIDAFLKRVETGKYRLDQNSVIVADEVSQIGIRHQSALLTLAAKHGCQLVEIGDPRQCQAVESPAINLIARAIGDENIPKLLTTIRQKTERDREVATMFRNGEAFDGIAALQEDGRFHLVAGHRDAVVQRTAELWRTMTTEHAADAEPYSVVVMTQTNAQALEVGKAIRALRREAGEIGKNDTVLLAMDPNSKETFDLPITTGDRLRLFMRTYDADTPKRGKLIGSNGDVVNVLKVLPTGLQVRNLDGEEGRVTWSQMRPWRAPTNDPIRVTMGMAQTVASAQSMTRSAAIFSLPDGSGQIRGHETYTAMSRHEHEAHLIVSDGAERKAIVSRQRMGLGERPSQEDVLHNIANNLSRFTEKSQATELLSRAIEVRRGVTNSVNRGIEAGERSAKRGGLDLTDYQQSRLAQAFHHVVEQAHRVARHVWREPDQGYDRGR